MAQEDGKIKKIEFKEKKFTWTNITFPTKKSTDYLKRKYKFHHLDLEDCLSENQRPKIDDYENYIFLVLHIPIKNIKTKDIRTSEIHFFVGQNYLITVHEGNSILQKAFEACKKNAKKKKEYMEKGSGYLLYMLIDDVFESNFPLLDELSKQTSELEVEVFDPSASRDKLKDILLLKKDIINFRRIIMPQRAIIAQLEHKNKKFLPEDLDVYFDDTVDKIEKIWNNLENLKELVASIQDTNESLISHNTNNIIKILTLLSVIILPLTFITGFYGMNVRGLPFAEHPFSTAIVACLILIIALAMVFYFKYKRWF